MIPACTDDSFLEPASAGIDDGLGARVFGGHERDTDQVWLESGKPLQKLIVSIVGIKDGYGVTVIAQQRTDGKKSCRDDAAPAHAGADECDSQGRPPFIAGSANLRL
jgi:hypothetical protein